ncbi:hypothetical protein LR48_Vigan06g138600 [Vigna angularis]|uniref:Uncharacterized protein n=1 Tax=Phaseolus angularis TaxID=3914 RepID=A0A0L9UT87_PHAAN|nr:hypothetical protein LR48_Vigan06g138600 [Vigna angularis]
MWNISSKELNSMELGGMELDGMELDNMELDNIKLASRDLDNMATQKRSKANSHGRHPEFERACSQELQFEGKWTYRFQNAKVFGSGGSSRQRGSFYGA